jgi:hypothetical protein
MYPHPSLAFLTLPLPSLPYPVRCMSVLVEYVHFAAYRTVMYRTALRLPGRKTRQEKRREKECPSAVRLLTLQYYKLTNKHSKRNLVLSRLTVLLDTKYVKIK